MRLTTDAARAAVLAALALAAAGCGCRRDEAPPPAEQGAAQPAAVETDPVKKRMCDPVYVGKLNTGIDERKKAAAARADAQERYEAAKDALKAAKEAGEPAEKLAALEAEKAKLHAELKERNQELIAIQARLNVLVATQMEKSGAKAEDLTNKGK